MLADNCPFELIKPEPVDDTRRKDRFASFEIPIDPNDADGTKLTFEHRKLFSTDPEDILSFIEQFDKLVEDMEIPEGAPRFRIFKSLCAGDPKKKWGVVVTQHAQNQNQANFETCIKMFLRQYMDHEISLDTKKWLQKVKKPMDMKVQTFGSHSPDQRFD